MLSYSMPRIFSRDALPFRAFLDFVCSDIAEIKDETIKYFPDGYSQWEKNQSELEVIIACLLSSSLIRKHVGRLTTATCWMRRPGRRST